MGHAVLPCVPLCQGQIVHCTYYVGLPSITSYGHIFRYKPTLRLAYIFDIHATNAAESMQLFLARDTDMYDTNTYAFALHSLKWKSSHIFYNQRVIVMLQ